MTRQASPRDSHQNLRESKQQSVCFIRKFCLEIGKLSNQLYPDRQGGFRMERGTLVFIFNLLSANEEIPGRASPTPPPRDREKNKAGPALKVFSFPLDQILQHGRNAIFREMSLSLSPSIVKQSRSYQDPFLGPTEDYFGTCHFDGL